MPFEALKDSGRLHTYEKAYCRAVFEHNTEQKTWGYEDMIRLEEKIDKLLSILQNKGVEV